MRLSRSSLLSRLTGPDVPNVVLLEAPAGYGKSWLIRRAAGEGATKLRGEIGPPLGDASDPVTLVIDDAHLLADDDVDRLVERIEDAPATARMFIAGRMLSDAIHEAVRLVDGLVIDADASAVKADEVCADLDPALREIAAQVVDAADGCIRVVALAIDQSQRTAGTDAGALTSRIVRAAAEQALKTLNPRQRSIVGLLARAPGLEAPLLERIGGPGFLREALASGVPLRRQVTGGLDVATPLAFRSLPVESVSAQELASELFERGRAIEAIGLLLDAGETSRAAVMVMDLSDSLADTVDPQVLLGLLVRLGPATERQPLLLLRRAAATQAIGHTEEATRDLDRAVVLAAAGDASVRRRVSVDAARAQFAEGRRDEAARMANEALTDLGEGEDRTFARAYEVLAECAATSDARPDLQRAAECFRIAATAWEGCGEFAKARHCRRELALAALVPLGRFDEALSQVGQMLGTNDLSEAERAMTMLFEGFVLYNANRLESAESRFTRIMDIGYVRENPRLVAAAAWGRALVAVRRDDLPATLRWIASAENTSLGDDDDLHGVPFLCDVATALGALGEVTLAQRYLDRAVDRRPVYPDQIVSTAFVLDARKGVLGDLDGALRSTPPAEWWRVKLAAAYASAAAGRFDEAHLYAAESERELLALGFSDATSLGEGRLHSELQTLLERRSEELEAPPAPRRARPVESAIGKQVRVIGDPISVQDGDGSMVVPPGNPQRLVGVVVANGGSASFDQLSEAIWPGEDVDKSRTRLRNVLLRLRRVVGDVIVRSGAGVRIAPGVSCDLHQFERLARDALASTRADPDLAGRLASDALEIAHGTVFVDFEYEEWAVTARRSAEQQMIGLYDLLSVQAEDAGDLPLAQALAERALRLDRYTDSRYVRLAELLTLQDRVAAAVAVLDDAAEIAREMGGVLTSSASDRRRQLVRETATGA